MTTSDVNPKSKEPVKGAYITSVGFVIAAIIGAVALLFQNSKNEKKDEKECVEIRQDATDYIARLNNCLLQTGDGQRKLNLLYWRERCEGIMKYDCDKIQTSSTEILSDFLRTQIEIKLCEN
jgi:hypothetical protein